MAGEILKTLIIFTFIAAIVLGSQFIQAGNRARLLRTVDTALKQGQPLPPEVLDLVNRQTAVTKPKSELSWGLVTLSVGVGIAIFGQVMGAIDTEARTAITGLSAIPTCIGVAGVLLHFLGRKSS